MEFFGKEPGAPDAALLDVVKVIGSQVGEFIRRNTAEESLHENDQQLRAIFENAAVGIVMTGLDSRVLRVNKRYCEIVGYREEELLGRDMGQLQLQQKVVPIKPRASDVLGWNAEGVGIEKALVRRDGTVVWVSSSTSAIRDPSGEPMYFVTVVQDISGAKRAAAGLQESEELFRQLANNVPQVFWISDSAQKRAIYISPACETLLGIPAEDLKHSRKRIVKAVHPEDRRRVYEARQGASAGTYDETFRVIHTDGTIRWVHDRAFPVKADGAVYRIAGITEDVTDRRQVEERLTQLAHFDMLTRLPNRALFLDRLHQALLQARRNKATAGLMFIDVDGFKQVNDTLGHDAGDNVLRELARRLTAAVRATDTVARFGGDEFAVVLTVLHREDAALVATKILTSINEPVNVEGRSVVVSGSIGIAVFPSDSTDEKSLIKQADAAMCRAKQLGKNRFEFYDAR